MQYTPSQYRKLEHEFLQQFDYKTIDLNIDEQITQSYFVHYKNILNLINIRKNNNFNKKKQLLLIKKKQKNRPLYYTKRKMFTESILQEDQNQNNTVFLTDNVNYQYNPSQSNHIHRTSFNKFSKTILVSQIKQKQSFQSQNQNSESKIKNGQNQCVQQIQDKICGQFSVLQSLKHQQSQVQQAIFCFKKRIRQIKKTMNGQQLKKKDVGKILIQNKNQMIKARLFNQKVKQSYEKTKKHFDRDLSGKKNSQISIHIKNKSQLDEAVVNNICLRKMKNRLLQQQQQLKNLNYIKEDIQQKQNKYKDIYSRQKQIYDAYEGIKNAQLHYMKIGHEIVSILDKTFEQFDKSDVANIVEKIKQQSQKKINFKKTMKTLKSFKKINKQSKHSNHSQMIKKQKQKQNLNNKSQIQQYCIKQGQLKNIVQEIFQLYKKAKQQQIQFIDEFKQLIGERNQNVKKLNQITLKVNYCHHCIEGETNRDFQIKLQDINNLLMIQDNNQNQMNKITKRLNFINNSFYSLQERLKYFLIRHIYAIKKIIDLWLNSDENANKFLEYFLQRISQLGFSTQQGGITNIDDKQLTKQQTNSMLMNFFQNWQKYLIYTDILHQNSYIYRYVNKSLLFNLFKRIVKTKKNNRNLKTQNIFHKGVDSLFQNQRKNILMKIFENLQFFKQFIKYLKMVQNQQIKLNVVFNYQILNLQKKVEIQNNFIQSDDMQTQGEENQIKLTSNKKIQVKKQSQWNYQQKNRKSFEQFYHKQKKQKNKNKNKINLKFINIHNFYQDLKTEIQKVKVLY